MALLHLRMARLLQRQIRVVHGHTRAFVTAGQGPALLLLHGIGNSAQTWAGVLPRLAEKYTVIAPDLLGHGSSDKPRGDYSVAGYANGMRDLLSVLDIEQATVVGHSLGGGIALQFAYQFPERCQRLVLVDSGGLGPELTVGLRLATLPGAERARRAFLRTLRSVADVQGQAVTALDRLYLSEMIPMLVVWGSRDRIVPAAHAEHLRTLAPSARVEIFPGAGHWPHISDPERFCAVLLDFLAGTTPAAHDRDTWRSVLAQGRGRDALSARRSS